MTDYQLVMSLLLPDRSYRDIETIVCCSHRTIAKAKKVCHDEGLTATSQVEALSAEEIDALFADGRKRPSGEFVAFDVAAMIKKRVGKKKRPLRVLWANYLDTERLPEYLEAWATRHAMNRSSCRGSAASALSNLRHCRSGSLWGRIGRWCGYRREGRLCVRGSRSSSAAVDAGPCPRRLWRVCSREKPVASAVRGPEDAA